MIIGKCLEPMGGSQYRGECYRTTSFSNFKYMNAFHFHSNTKCHRIFSEISIGRENVIEFCRKCKLKILLENHTSMVNVYSGSL